MNHDVCRHGHDMTPANTGTRAGRPYCRTCNRMTAHERSHCLDGHQLTPANTIVTKGGMRKCRRCRQRTLPFPLVDVRSWDSGGQSAVNGGQIAIAVLVDGREVARVNITGVGQTAEAVG